MESPHPPHLFQPSFPPELEASLDVISQLVDWDDFNATVETMAWKIKDTPLASHFKDQRISHSYTARQGGLHPSVSAARLFGYPPSHELTETEYKRAQLLADLEAARFLVTSAVLHLKNVQIDLFGATHEFETKEVNS